MLLLRDMRGEIGGSRTIYRSNSERSEGSGAQWGTAPEFIEAGFMGGGAPQRLVVTRLRGNLRLRVPQHIPWRRRP